MNWLGKHKVWIMLLVSILFSYWLIGDNLKSRWWIIDDHEIMSNIGTDYRLSPAKWLTSFKNSEAFKPGSSLRYRPVYYALRFTEMMLWGKNPFLWYLFRFIIFVFFQISVWWITRKFIGSWLAALFVGYLLTFNFWPDLVSRLGPSETYALIGLPLFIFSFINLWKFETSKKNWILLLLSVIMCVGVKENFIFLLMPLFLIFIRLVFNKKMSRFDIFIWLLSIFFSFFVFWAFFTASQKSGVDIYSQSTNIGSRIALLKLGFELLIKNLLVWVVPLVICILFLMFSFFKRKLLKVVLHNIFHFIFWWSFFAVIWISQYVFYNGNWPLGNRYDYPGVLVPSLIYFISIVYFQKLLRLVGHSRLIVFRIVISIFVIFTIIRVGYERIIYVSKMNQKRSVDFTTKIIEISDYIKGQPDLPIVFFSYSLIDLEPLESTRMYLRSNGILNPIYINAPVCLNDNTITDWYIYLSNVICGWSNEGKLGEFVPLADLKSDKLICLGFSGTVENKECVYTNIVTNLDTVYEY